MYQQKGLLVFSVTNQPRWVSTFDTNMIKPSANTDSKAKEPSYPWINMIKPLPFPFCIQSLDLAKCEETHLAKTKTHEGNTFMSQFLKKLKELYSRNKYIPFCRTTTSCHIISCHDFISWWHGSWALAKKGSVCSVPGLFYAMKWAY